MKSKHKKQILQNAGKKSAKELAAELGLKERTVKKFLESRPKEQLSPTGRKEEAGSRKRLERKGVEKRDLRKVALLCLLIIFAGILVYSNAFDGGFIWDDEYLIEKNVFVKDWSNLPKAFTEDFGKGAGKTYGFFRPLQIIAYMVEYSLWGLNVRGYHAVSILAHLLTALSIFWLVNVVFKDKILSLFTALLYVVHPVHTEAVDYLSGLGDPLCVPFLLLSLIMYLKLGEEENRTHLIIMLASYALALFTKEVSLALPLLILAYHFAFKTRIRVPHFVALIAVLCLYLIVRIFCVTGVPFNTGAVATVFERVPGLLIAIVHYLRLLILPFNLHMEYGRALYAMTNPTAVAGLLLVTVLLAVSFTLRGKKPLFSFSILWFFITLLPVSNLYPVAFFMAEHYLYLPSVGFFLVIGASLSLLYHKEKMRHVAMAVLVLLLLYFGVLTYKQNLYWRDALTFYKRTLKFAPESARITNELGRLYYTRGDRDDAVRLLEKAIEIDPGYALPYTGLGAVFNNERKFEKAIPYLEKALALDPTDPITYYNLAIAHSNLGRSREAERVFKQAIQLNPRFAEAYTNLGWLYTNMGRKTEAIESFKKAIETNPHIVYPYFNLAVLYEETGRIEEAVDNLQNAVRLAPDHGKAHKLLALLYFETKRYDLAVKHCDAAQRLGVRFKPSFLEKLEPYRKGGM
jgi:tetratricopeptide (TPR) repeat protein